eukprot:ANDGO_04472.mRNA.1 E3 ubiquitin-protein ligase RGLG2
MGLFGSKHHEVLKYIPDKYRSVEDVYEALRRKGVESSELVFFVDFTKSNHTSGTRTFGGRCLHAIDQFTKNPYERGIEVLGRTLSRFDDDGFIPGFGFGDVTTADRAVFALENLVPEESKGILNSMKGFERVAFSYRCTVPQVFDHMSGPTSFAPAIHKAIEIVRASGNRYHIAVIIADGQVSPGSPMQETVAAIQAASHYPLSIVCLGVGDGPFSDMHHFDDKLPGREFDNFQFVEMAELEKKYKEEQFDAAFACAALQEIPDQYKSIVNLGYFNRS